MSELEELLGVTDEDDHRHHSSWDMAKLRASVLWHGPDLATRVRHARCWFTPLRSIHGHHGETGSVLRFPFGFAWRNLGGIRMCPLCGSCHPDDALAVIERVQFWTPTDKVAEMQQLVSRGEMESSWTNLRNAQTPPSYHGYVHYAWTQPISTVHIVTGNNRPMTLETEHLIDMTRPISEMVFHLNRLNPNIQWQIIDGVMTPTIAGGVVTVGNGFLFFSPQETSDENPSDEDPPTTD